ncbi:MAG: glycosyltransferase [Planctomycetes bacterium]|nr:glycosyltransferase [Planctomycetota bacterium]
MGQAFPIAVKVWAGEDGHDFRYIRRSLPGLLRSALPEEATVILIDDCSTDRRVQPFLAALAREHKRVEVWTNPHRMGPNKGQEYNFPRVSQRFPDAPFCVTCDDDIIYHAGWLQRLIQVHREARAIGLRGVFTALNVPFRPHHASVQLPTSEVLLKERQAALNWVLPRDVYEAVGPFRDTGVAYDTDYCGRMAALGLPVICLKPSWVQNIGYRGAYQHDETFRAPDYVGRRDVSLVLQDGWYLLRRMMMNTAERIPEGSFKNGLKFLSKPIRVMFKV